MPNAVPVLVRPRFLSADSGEVLPLEDAVRDRLAAGARGVIWLTGSPGSGRTIAIEHLRARFAGEPNLILIRSDLRAESLSRMVEQSRIREKSRENLVIAAVPDTEAGRRAEDLVWSMARWDRDEWIEYLLAAHPARCASVMSRLSSRDRLFAGGNPEVWRQALDALAGDDELPNAAAAVLTAVRREIAAAEAWASLSQACLETLDAKAPDAALLLAKQGAKPTTVLLRLLRHRAVRMLLAIDFVAQCLERRQHPPPLAEHLPGELIEGVANRIRPQPAARAQLLTALSVPALQPLAASLCRAVDANWKPSHGRNWNLRWAQLKGVRWPQLYLKRANAEYANFRAANLQGVNWIRGIANGANFRQADLSKARLDFWSASGADLEDADLTSVCAPGADLSMAVLASARLCDADLRRANLFGAILRGTQLHRAKLCYARLSALQLDDCDFQDADLSQATLDGLDLRSCRWDGASFRSAGLIACNLEELSLERVDFDRAFLGNALLTGSRLRRCSLNRANLQGAGLAEIDWEGVSLRHADLRGASFHLGSSRSGLVGSPLACEGSRTGFYTDEFLEQDYRPPEDIRKANLRGADLRGAQVEGVDFYLVDLRGAKYDAALRDYFRSCGAILEDRCRS